MNEVMRVRERERDSEQDEKRRQRSDTERERGDAEEDKRRIFGGKRRPCTLKFVWRNSPLLPSTSGVNW